jgi:hypothetical protein
MAWAALSTWHGPAMMAIGASLANAAAPTQTLGCGREPGIVALSMREA